MKPIKVFKMGSRVFFEDMPGFHSKDYDELCILDTYNFPGNSFRLNIRGKDVFFYRNLTKEEFIKDTLDSTLPMVAGKFLVPEFSKDLGITISDLAQLSNVFTSMDEKHIYEQIIFNAYIENNGFFLTPEQKSLAYMSYIKTRNNNGANN